MNSAPTIITESHGTAWRCARAFDNPHRPANPARAYWVSFSHGPTSRNRPGVVGFYAASIDQARDILERKG